MDSHVGAELTLVTLNGIDITEKIKGYYGINRDWQAKLWKYSDIFGIDSLNQRFYIEYTTQEQRKHWTFGFVNDINQYFNPPRIFETKDLSDEFNTLNIH
tara:strand:+ start:59 stop:358 length:300 start_codon:yes stop_codon:yes gene_type:complete